jgi:precorrin-8X/cobalt-precorrin-8 methylmutase
LLDGGIIAIGNAPTALLEVVRMINDGLIKPALVIGMPVGFVSAAESKAVLSEISSIPWIVIDGRKGGSTLVVAAIHALLALAEGQQKAAG